MLLSEPLASLIGLTFFRMSLKKKKLSQQLMNVRFFLSYNWIQRIKMKNEGPKHTYLAR